jgi:hypothetical protein
MILQKKTPASRRRAFRKEVPDVGNGTVSIRFSTTKIIVTIAVGDVVVVVEIPLTAVTATLPA